MKYITGLLLLAFAVPSWAEDEEPLVLHCVYESSAGIFDKGAALTSTSRLPGLVGKVPIREKETLRIIGAQIEHLYETPIPIVDRTDDLIVGRYYDNSEMLFLQQTLVLERQTDLSYSVLRSWMMEKVNSIDYGTCYKF